MNNLRIICMLTLFTLPAFAVPIQSKVIYGTDDRQDIELSENSTFKVIAKSTAQMVPKYWISNNPKKERYDYNWPSIIDVCPDERFAGQIVAGTCSGFLVADDLLVTAGHCMEYDYQCEDNFWIFDIRVDVTGKSPDFFKYQNIYSCKEIVATLNSDDGDFSIIRLDRAADRNPLSLRKSGQIDLGQELFMIGHPSGLPSKITTSGFVRDISSPYFFSTNLDVFSGNSGSAVFNKDTLKVEGIVSYGDGQDYILDEEQRCMRPGKFPSDYGKGQFMTRITLLNDLLSTLK